MSLVRVQFEEPFCIIGSTDKFSDFFGGVAALDSWGIAKSVKARDFDSRIRWFESNYPSQILPFFGGYCGADEGSLAQLVEHLTFNQRVPGSSPG